MNDSTRVFIDLATPINAYKSGFWPSLHHIILEAYKPTREDWPLPKVFERLSRDINDAGHAMIRELGPDAMVAVAKLNNQPIGCAAVQKFKIIEQEDVALNNYKSPHGPHAPATEEQEDSSNSWELTLVTTSSKHRGRGIARGLIKILEGWVVLNHQADHLMVRTVDEISGDYWRKLGFVEVPEMCITLPKGFSHVLDAPEELRMEKDVALWTGRRNIT